MISRTEISGRNEVLEAIRSHLAVRNVEPAIVVESARLTDDLEIDSLDLQNLAQDLEDRFGVAIGPEDAMRIETVGEVMDFVATRATARRSAQAEVDSRR